MINSMCNLRRRYVQAGLSPAEASRLTIALRYVELLPAVLQVFCAPASAPAAKFLVLHLSSERRQAPCLIPSLQGTSKVVVSANVSDASHPIVNAAGALQVPTRAGVVASLAIAAFYFLRWIV
jgi:hypothetical protein